MCSPARTQFTFKGQFVEIDRKKAAQKSEVEPVHIKQHHNCQVSRLYCFSYSLSRGSW